MARTFLTTATILSVIAFALAVVPHIVPLTVQAQSCPISCPDSCSQVSDPSVPYSIFGPTDFCKYPQTGCSASNQYAWVGCCRADYSPIVIDLKGNGFKLTDLQGGVRFRLSPSLIALRQMSWVAEGSDNAWLVLDRNGDGKITDATELFGNLTPQPNPPQGAGRNGFLALAVFDRPDAGGNEDEFIDRKDRIFSALRTWNDKNHNGISEDGELQPLSSNGITGIALRYQVANRTDQHGNVFRYRAKLYTSEQSEIDNRFAWDVFLQLGGPAIN